MPRPSPETARLQFLDDTLRQRFPGFIDETSDISGEPPRHERPRLPAHERWEQAIGDIVKKRIPVYPAYNAHILNTLKIFRANNIAAMDPEKDRQELIRIVNSAHKKRPVFLRSFDRDTFLHLHTLLKDYSEIRGGNLRRFPSIETLGYRLDEVRLRKFDGGQTLERARGRINLRYATDDLRDQNIAVSAPGDHREDGTSGPPDVWVDRPEGLTTKLSLRKQQLLKLNRFIDTICPPGKYFNSMRQQLIHQVWSNREFFEDYKATLERNEKKGWGEPGHTVKNENGQIVNYNFVWMPQDKWKPMKEFIDGMNKMLEDKKKNLITAAGRYPQPLTPGEAVKVDQLMCSHARLSERHAAQRDAGQAEQEEPPNAGRMPTGAKLAPGQIPMAIKRAVTIPSPPVRTNPVARHWAQRCAETIEEIAPFKDRATLEKRLLLQRLAFSSRAEILATGCKTHSPQIVDQADVSDVSDAEDYGSRVHPLTVADLGDPVRDDEITEKRFNKLLNRGKISYAKPETSYDKLERAFRTQMRDKREAFNQLARDMNRFNDAWTGKLREPPPAKEPANTRDDVSRPGKLRKAASAFQTPELNSAARETDESKLSFRTLSGRPLPPPTAVPFDPPLRNKKPRRLEGGDLERKPPLRPALRWEDIARAAAREFSNPVRMRAGDGQLPGNAETHAIPSSHADALSDSEDEEYHTAPSSPRNEDIPMGGMEEEARGRKRRREDDGLITETADSPEPSPPHVNALPDNSSRPAKRSRVDDRTHERSRERTPSRG